MPDFTSGFWGLFIAVTTIASIGGLAWFTWANSRAKQPKKGPVETMGHVWDEDLAEFNNPMPSWWLNLFFITLVWGAGYLLLYPGLGTFGGLLGWNQVEAWEEEVARAEERYGPLFAQYAETPIAELAQNPDAVAMGDRLYATYCSTCHGSDARGARGFPNLRDEEWLYGGAPEQIETTILNGRQAAMPAWQQILGDDGVAEVVAYVEQVSGRDVDATAASAGEKHYKTYCVACHGPDAKGNTALGAPNLTNDIWLYGGSTARLTQSIAGGRNGQMPANEKFLGKAKVHLLASYVYSFRL